MSDQPTIQEGDIENPITIYCPNCSNEGVVPEWWIGIETECIECETRFTITDN